MKFLKKEERLPILLVTPVILILTGVLFLPSIWSTFLSFQYYTFGYTPKFIGLSNYIEILSDKMFVNAIFLNFAFVILDVALEFLLGLGAALLLSRRFPFQKVWVSLIIAPFAVSPVVSIVAWKNLISPDFGLITYLLSFFNISTEKWMMEPVTALLICITINVWREFPFTTMILYAAITTIPPERIEAALIDGASKFQRFRYITVPSIWTSIVVALTFRTIFAFRTFDVIWILTQGGPLGGTTILSVYLYLQSFKFLRLGVGASVGVIILLFTFLISAPYLRTLYKQIMARGYK
ncbi:MAG: sugar ABC transporter permease [Nitrososphaeria archaeon]|nr:sugar ABC transporter permease [Nitrososphaeria archaeon]